MRSIQSILRRPRISGAVLAVVALVSGTGLAAVLAAPESFGASGASCAAGTLVRTTTGPVCGIVDKGVNEWLGIPYAAPPVGNLRWAPPRRHAPWTTTLQATAFGSQCLQPGFPPAIPAGGSENCLYLNVWEPRGSVPSSGRPVMVHIHGGGFYLGSGNGDNTLLANTGHEVIVSMNYRLGIFGFLANSALGRHSGDYGLQDQQAALRWVQENIRAFGGNPNRVTIFGESAGGSSVCDQIASPTAAGLFHRAISTSGEYNTLFGVPAAAGNLEPQDCKASLPTRAQADRIGARFAAAVGCGSASDTAACLRQVPAAVVEKVAGSGYQYGGQGTIAPTINGTTLTMSLRQALRTGAVNRVPVIAGVDRDENLTGVANSPAQYRQLVHAQYGPLAAEVLARYPLDRFYSPFVAWRTVAADSDTVCPAIVTDQELARWMPVYGYEIDDGNAPTSFFLPAGQPNGSYHVADWFLTPTPGLDANLQVLQSQELTYVTTFARTGKPTGLHTPTWPEFNRSRQIMSLAPGADSQTLATTQIAVDHNCSFWDKVSPKP
jgi:para-nitrobenzyl esterase